ncbi:MAG: UDP-N-acetylmuramoyl-L-alanine--D-glutamate ligase [Candidatus Omnitrophota bacterium]
MIDLKNKKVTIIGAARSGLAVADLVLRLGGISKISDSKEVVSAPVGCMIEQGGHTKEFIQDSHYVVLSPGVRIDSQVAKWAKEKGIEVMGEVELAFRLCPCPIVAITGSNGKTTTTTLIAEILRKAGKNVCLCGNIGSPFASHVLSLNPADVVVLEISSFQLESTIHFKPHVALWLNFSQNHLDRHKDLNEYFDAKKKIFANQDKNDFAVINFEQGELRELVERLESEVVYFNDQQSPVGITNPNYRAAFVTAKALGISEDISRNVFKEFKGVEHRLELVRTLDGVDYINDSKSTTAVAGRWALESVHKPLIMICGGSDKHIDYNDLKSLVGEKVKNMIAIGAIKEQIRQTFADVVHVEFANSLESAVELARQKACSGDCVILSPMTASFDMFKDYEHRGRVFKEIVTKLT